MDIKGIINGINRNNRNRNNHCTDGVPIVLTSPPNEISDYNLDPFVAFLSSFPNNFLLRTMVKKKFLDSKDNGDGSAVFAPYGLRKVESILLKEFGESEVVVVHPDNLDRFVGLKTKVVGISTMDPMGLAYATTTYSSILAFGSESINSAEFKRLLSPPAIQKYKPKIIVGGAGSWQIEETKKLEEYGIDTLVLGEGENSVLEVFTRAVNGEDLPKIIRSTRPSPDSVSLIRHASTYGVVEITRGCGRGCQFCSPIMCTKGKDDL